MPRVGRRPPVTRVQGQNVQPSSCAEPTARSGSTLRVQVRDETGLTLAEMLIALVILGVLFSATAGALISFSQASVNNERRVQSTATLNRLHEELQALRWEDAVLYRDEVAALPSLDGLDTTANPPTFDGEPIVVIDGPGCDATDPDCRIGTVPVPHDDPLLPTPLDGRDYEVFRLVTWSDREGAPEEGLKRFTTVVRWEVFGRTVEQRFDSERAPTPAEISEGNPDLQFLVTPSEVELREVVIDEGTDEEATELRNDVPIELNADFALLGQIASAEVRFETAGGGSETLPLSKDGLSERFSGTIPAAAYTFEEGSQSFEVIGTGAGTTYSTSATVTFVAPGDLGGGGTAPTISQVSVLNAPMTRVVGRVPPDNNRLCERIKLEVQVHDAKLHENQERTSVRANYNSHVGPQSVTLQPPPSTNSTSGIFTYEFPQGASSPWRPTETTQVKDTFKVVAQNPSSGPSPVVNSQELTFTYSDKNNQQC
jgi:prepilin-type N-terminal cleavage/methylation domain-containing protein